MNYTFKPFQHIWLILLLFSLSTNAHAISWPAWLAQFKADAIADGIDPDFFDDTFRGIRPSKRVKHFDRTQPERRLTFSKYRKTRANNYRIRLGQREFRKHAALLNEVGDNFSVDPCFITSLWGMESSYGRYLGNFPVIKSLATLAYDKRRSQFFRKELLYALHILQGGHVSPAKFKGEWAGASGQAQFLPSSWYRYAVDYDQDGRKNIWTSLSDSFASIANYLKKNGWQSNQPWAVEVSVPSHFDDDLVGYKVKKSVAEWQALGVRSSNGRALPGKHLTASVLKPYGGPALLIFNNFRVLLRYNNSTYYAGTVGYMADRICRR